MACFSCCCCCCRCRSPKSWFCSACACIVLSLGFFCQAYWAFNLHSSLSPVFTDIDCRLKFPKIHKVSFKGGFHVDFTATTVCENPNPYVISLESTAPVNVYMGKKKVVKVAEVLGIPPTDLLPDKTSFLNVDVRMQPTRQSWGVMFGTMFTSFTPIYVENSIALVVDVNLYFMRMQVKKIFTRNCGFNLQLFRGGAFAKVGPMACAVEWEDLVIPEVGDDAFKGKLDLEAKNLAEDEIKKGTMMKDVGLGIAMIAGVGWGVVLMFGSCYCCYRGNRAANEPRRRSTRQRDGSRGRHRSDLGHSKVDTLQERVKMQARELRSLKQQLAEEELRRKLAARDKKLRLMQASLSEETTSPAELKIAQQERELKALKARLAQKSFSGEVDEMAV